LPTNAHRHLLKVTFTSKQEAASKKYLNNLRRASGQLPLSQDQKVLLRIVMIGKSLSLANIICRLIAARSLTNIKWILLKDTFKSRNKFILFGQSFCSILPTNVQEHLQASNRGCIFSHVRPFYEQAVSDLDP